MANNPRQADQERSSHNRRSWPSILSVKISAFKASPVKIGKYTIQRQHLILYMCWNLGVILCAVVIYLVYDPTTNDINLVTPTAARLSPSTQIILALQPIREGQSLLDGSIGWRNLPANYVPPDIIADESEVIGKVARENIAPGQVIVRSMLADLSDKQMFTSPVISDGIAFFSRGWKDDYQEPGMIQATDTNLKRNLWEFIGGHFILADGMVYLLTTQGIPHFNADGTASSLVSLFALDAVTREESWQFSNIEEKDMLDLSLNLSRPVAADDKILFNLGQALYAVDAATGERIWRYATEGAILSAPAVADGVVYVSDSEGFFYAIEADTGRQKWRIDP